MLRTTTTQPPADLQTLAKPYWAMGANINAIAPQSKSPCHLWTRFQIERQTEKEFDSLPWTKATGIGINNGVNGWHTFDLDKCHSQAPAEAILLALGLPLDYPWFWRSGSHKGYGIAIRCDEALPEDCEIRDHESSVIWGDPLNASDFDHIELRWQHQSLIPPSLHPSGQRYEWINEPPTAEPALFSAQQVINAFLTVAEPRLSPPQAPQQRRKLAVTLKSEEKPLEAFKKRITIREALESYGARYGKKAPGGELWHCPGSAHKGGDKAPSLLVLDRACNCYHPDCELHTDTRRSPLSAVDVVLRIENIGQTEFIKRFCKDTDTEDQTPPQTPPQPSWSERRSEERRARREQNQAILEGVRTRAALDDQLGPTARRVLFYLLDRAGSKGWCRPSAKTIAADLSIGYRTVHRVLRQLELDYIETHGNGAGKSTAIRLIKGCCTNIRVPQSTKALPEAVQEPAKNPMAHELIDSLACDFFVSHSANESVPTAPADEPALEPSLSLDDTILAFTAEHGWHIRRVLKLFREYGLDLWPEQKIQVHYKDLKRRRDWDREVQRLTEKPMGKLKAHQKRLERDIDGYFPDMLQERRGKAPKRTTEAVYRYAMNMLPHVNTELERRHAAAEALIAVPPAIGQPSLFETTEGEDTKSQAPLPVEVCSAVLEWQGPLVDPLQQAYAAASAGRPDEPPKRRAVAHRAAQPITAKDIEALISLGEYDRARGRAAGLADSSSEYSAWLDRIDRAQQAQARAT